MSTVSFLESLDADTRARLMRGLTIRNYGRREIVIAQDDASADVYFVLKGLAVAAIYSEDGKRVSYRDIGEGAIFGELSAIDGAPRSATVMAQGSLTVGWMPGPEFRRFIETDPGFMWAMMRYMGRQVRDMTGRIFEYSTMPVRDRLIHELIRMAEAASEDGTTAAVRPAPTHADLATRISSHREAVSREMSALSKRKLVVRGNGAYRFADIEALRRFSEGE